MLVTVDLTGVLGEPDTQLHLHPHGIEVKVGMFSAWAYLPVGEYAKHINERKNTGRDSVAIEPRNNTYRVLAFVPHPLIHERKAEYVIPSGVLLSKIQPWVVR